MSFEERLIEEVRGKPFLYDLSDSKYKNQSLREKTWKEISEKLGKDECTCRTRWKNLRDQFRKLNRKLNSQPSGSSANISQPKWQYYEVLSFLKESGYRNPTISSLTGPEISTEDESFALIEVDDEIYSGPSTSCAAPIPTTSTAPSLGISATGLDDQIYSGPSTSCAVPKQTTSTASSFGISIIEDIEIHNEKNCGSSTSYGGPKPYISSTPTALSFTSKRFAKQCETTRKRHCSDRSEKSSGSAPSCAAPNINTSSTSIINLLLF